jgi:hypothetical protein
MILGFRKVQKKAEAKDKASTEMPEATMTNKMLPLSTGPCVICGFSRREDKLMTELMNQKISTS